MINAWAQDHDESLWPEPFEFKPERFLTSDGHLVPAGQPPRDHFFPFSAGPRECVGHTLATSRMFLIMSTFAQHFNVLPATTLEDHVSCHANDLVLGPVLLPKSYEVRMVPR